MDNNIILLEYNEERGTFHHNYGNCEIESNGWTTIATTNDDKAFLFGLIVDIKNELRWRNHLSPYTADYIRIEWKLFCYAFNHIAKYLNGYSEQVNKNFDSAKSLARLGHGGFADLKEDLGLADALEYDPLNYNDSNF